MKITGNEYSVKVQVLLTVEEATLLKTCADHHYDYAVRACGTGGAINALANTATWAQESADKGETGYLGHPCSFRDLDTMLKALENHPAAIRHLYASADAHKGMAVYWGLIKEFGAAFERINSETNRCRDTAPKDQ